MICIKILLLLEEAIAVEEHEVERPPLCNCFIKIMKQPYSKALLFTCHLSSTCNEMYCVKSCR